MGKHDNNDQDDANTRDEADVEESDSNQASDSDEVELGPNTDKIGERPDNLRQRGEWFQKRTGRK